MNIFFDTDYTILGVDESLRPHLGELFQYLTHRGHSIYIWSGNGIRTKDIEKHRLSNFVKGYFEKPVHNYWANTSSLPTEDHPNMVIDDNLEIVATLGGIWVTQYYFPNKADIEMKAVKEIITDIELSGTSEDPRFRQLKF
ncbi:MAG: hypothetical protein DK303_001381 [Chloroflexi bacterium]|nr:MAG: hypothetical protein DK303_001381 [Chloroflexota bacterium]